LAGKLVKGKFDLGTEDHPGAVLGSGIENALGIESDRSIQPMTVYLFKNGHVSEAADPIESLSTGNLAATGTFVIQQDFDNKYVITNLAFLKQELGLGPEQFSGIEIALHDPAQADLIKSKLSLLFGTSYLVQTRYEQNQSLYKVMRTEKWVIYAILTLILIVAAFNMVGALTMLVLEKKKDIQVLKAMGANNQLIQRIFLTEGLMLAAMGGCIGFFLAVSICWLQVKYKLVPLQGESFLIDYYPVKLVGTDFILVLFTILLVAVLASWFPSRKAAAEPIELRS
jgi:lipoprotein-releasing system permease protein